MSWRRQAPSLVRRVARLTNTWLWWRLGNFVGCREAEGNAAGAMEVKKARKGDSRVLREGEVWKMREMEVRRLTQHRRTLQGLQGGLHGWAVPERRAAPCVLIGKALKPQVSELPLIVKALGVVSTGE